jgi:hypothetical protein
MKNKLLILNIISYVILYHIVYESIYYFFTNKGDMEVTPVGFLISNYNRLESDTPFFLLIITSFIINMFVSGVLFYCIYKWYNKMSFIIMFFILLLVFIVISIILCVLLLFLAYITNSMLFFIFITLYFPMPIMVILMIRLFKFNQWIVERFSK